MQYQNALPSFLLLLLITFNEEQSIKIHFNIEYGSAELLQITFDPFLKAYNSTYLFEHIKTT